MLGPECVAQQKKFVSSRMMNCGDFTACPNDISDCGPPPAEAVALSPTSAGGRRTSRAPGILTGGTTAATVWSVVPQAWPEPSQATIGDMVMGAIPIPAETSDTARLRWVSNQPVTQAIIGAKMAAVAPPTRSPKTT